MATLNRQAGLSHATCNIKSKHSALYRGSRPRLQQHSGFMDGKRKARHELTWPNVAIAQHSWLESWRETQGKPGERGRHSHPLGYFIPWCKVNDWTSNGPAPPPSLAEGKGSREGQTEPECNSTLAKNGYKWSNLISKTQVKMFWNFFFFSEGSGPCRISDGESYGVHTAINQDNKTPQIHYDQPPSFSILDEVTAIDMSTVRKTPPRQPFFPLNFR